MSTEKEEYIKTTSGVWKIKWASDVNRYFECRIDGMTMTVFEGSNFWKQNEKGISTDLVDLADALVMVQPGYLPVTMDKNLLKDEKWVNSFIKKIKEEGYHYFLSSWDECSNLRKFGELTTKGFRYLF